MREKANNLGFDQVLHKPVSTVAEDGLWLEILDIEELYHPWIENKGADQLRSYCEADLRLCFRLCRLLVFPCGGSFIYLFIYLFIYCKTCGFKQQNVL